VTKFGSNSTNSSATEINLEIFNLNFIATELEMEWKDNSSYRSNAWVRCASGNVCCLDAIFAVLLQFRLVGINAKKVKNLKCGKSGKQFAALALRQRRGGDKKFGLYPPAFLILLTKLRRTNKKTNSTKLAKRYG